MGLQSDYTVGLAKETAYATPVTVTRFYEADTTLEEKVTTTIAKGYRATQRVARATRRAITKRESSGDITLDASSSGLGRLLAAAFGVSAIASIGTGAYQQLHTLKASDYLDSYTVQVGIPRLGSSTIDAYTYAGAQCSGLTVSAKEGGFAEIKTSWIAKSLSRVVSLATPSYPATSEMFSFIGGSLALGSTFTAPTGTALAVGGTPVATVKEITLSIKNGLDTGGFNLGAGGMRARPAAVKGGAKDAIAGSFTAEYTDRTFVDAYLDQEPLALVLAFAGTVEIATGVVPVLQFALPVVYLDGKTPQPANGDVISTQHAFTGMQGASGQPASAVYRSADSAI